MQLSPVLNVGILPTFGLSSLCASWCKPDPGVVVMGEDGTVAAAVATAGACVLAKLGLAAAAVACFCFDECKYSTCFSCHTSDENVICY